MVFKYTLWTKEEEQFVIDNHEKISNREIGEKIDKTLNQVNSKIQHLRKMGLIGKSKMTRVIPKAEKMDMEIEDGGLNLSLVKLEIGKEYEVFMPKQESQKLDDYFKGVFIQDTTRHITLKNKLGYCQSFLKADILIGIIKVKEVIK
ncbi:hypothetical protein [Tissierella pigra]|uniref:Uncharacterized protein n=1 Tax=Tissierella pigra TaxID=2607614 RepID=A0A6N7XZ96_9FIRM|nr:hypothetical protein [Tissierella pigra]MSU01894.1 hypothetical protein [Tissierella pigra]